MYALNKIIGYLISPTGFSMALAAVAIAMRILGRKRFAGWAIFLALANFWLWSTPWMSKELGIALESEFLVGGRVPTVESMPQADAIALHGGGMGSATNLSPYAEMWLGADRVWHAARLWKAGKAPLVFALGGDTRLTTAGLLEDLGVPTNAVVFAEEPRNTEEEAREVNARLKSENVSGDGASAPACKPRALVVTSAWHMKRTMLMYRKYAPNVEAIPAPCDFENTLGLEKASGWMSLLPDAAAFMANSVAFHEWLGYWGYKWLR